MLKKRILTALILVPFIVLGIFFLNTLQFAVFMATFIILGAWEWADLSGFYHPAQKLLYAIVIILLLVAGFLYRDTVLANVVVTVAVLWWIFLLILLMLYQYRRLPNLTLKNMKGIVGILVLVPAWLSMVLLHNDQNGVLHVFFLFLLVWLADSGAYFSGKRLGKTRLADRISPGKTWEGVIGSFIITLFAAVIFALATRMQVPDIIMFSLVCLITVMASVLGDLNESLIKRLNNVKDSGAIFPGHGGVMDRIDSLTAAAPVYLAGLWLTKVVK